MGRECIKELYPIQVTALEEARKANGLFAPISVGAGKTVIGLLLPLVLNAGNTVYLCLAGQEQQIRNEHTWLSQHINTPQLGKELYIVPYSILSLPRSSGLLQELEPGCIIADEGHRLRHRDSVGTARVIRYLATRPDCIFATWSGTLTARSLRDYSHLGGIALKLGSPLPIDPIVADEWALALDATKYGNCPSGALDVLKSHPKEPIRIAVHRRMVETQGVVYSKGKGMELPPLTFYWRKLPPSDAIQKALTLLNSTWTRPDGEELILALDVHRCADELACGFYYRWDFGNANVALVAEWKRARAAWHKWLRRKLMHPKIGQDSPALVEQAILSLDIPYPVAYHDWTDIRDKVLPTQQIRWIDLQWLNDIAAWQHENPSGVIWYTHDAVGSRLGNPYNDAARLLEALLAGRLEHYPHLSVKACGVGVDGLQRTFQRQLIACPMSNGAQLEQLLGRLHRQGQKHPVSTTFYERDRQSIEQAKIQAKYIYESMGIEQKLLTGTWE